MHERGKQTDENNERGRDSIQDITSNMGRIAYAIQINMKFVAASKIIVGLILFKVLASSFWVM